MMNLDPSRQANADAGTPAESSQVINLNAALSRMGHDQQLLADVASFFVEDAPPLVQQLRAHSAENLPEALARAAHTLKGLASNFDAQFVQALAAEIETQGFQNETEGVDRKIDALAYEVDRVIEALRDQLLGPPPSTR